MNPLHLPHSPTPFCLSRFIHCATAWGRVHRHTDTRVLSRSPLPSPCIWQQQLGSQEEGNGEEEEEGRDPPPHSPTPLSDRRRASSLLAPINAHALHPLNRGRMQRPEDQGRSVFLRTGGERMFTGWRLCDATPLRSSNDSQGGNRFCGRLSAMHRRCPPILAFDLSTLSSTCSSTYNMPDVLPINF